MYNDVLCDAAVDLWLGTHQLPDLGAAIIAMPTMNAYSADGSSAEFHRIYV